MDTVLHRPVSQRSKDAENMAFGAANWRLAFVAVIGQCLLCSFCNCRRVKWIAVLSSETPPQAQRGLVWLTRFHSNSDVRPLSLFLFHIIRARWSSNGELQNLDDTARIRRSGLFIAGPIRSAMRANQCPCISCSDSSMMKRVVCDVTSPFLHCKSCFSTAV